VDPKSAELLRILKEKVASGPADQIITTPEGGELRIRKAPEPGISMIIEPVGAAPGVGSIAWDPTPTRPPRYPDDFPFIAGRAVVLSRMPNGVTLQWHQTSKEDLAQVASELTTDGWAETTLPTPTMPGMTIRPFLRGDRQRVIVGGGEVLSLIDTAAK
jgi:hypothetical protein